MANQPIHKESELLKVLNYYGIQYYEKILCPFHADKNPSMQIDLEKDMWYCYGCQEGGGAYKFHKKMQELIGNTDPLAVEIVYHKIIKSKNGSIGHLNFQPVAIKDAAYYRQCLIEAKDYYYGLSSVDWFDDSANKTCLRYMKKRGFRRRVLNEIGAKYTYNDNTYPIIFPIKDNGKFKGWVCRTFNPEIEMKRKYLYNKGFRRRTTLAGDYSGPTVMLVEGFMDFLKARQFKVNNVAAVLGWKITTKQVNKLKAEGVTTIISALDNDTCGKKGTEYLKQFFKVVRFPYPEDVKDMGDLTKKQFHQCVEQIKGEIEKWD